MGILEDLYSGRIYPSEKIVPKEKNYRTISKEVGEFREYFRKKIAQEDKDKFNQWGELVHDTHYMECYANFSYGFRLGILLLIDVLTDYEMSGE